MSNPNKRLNLEIAPNEKRDLSGKLCGEVRFNESMSDHTRFHIGGPADIFVIPKNIYDIKVCIAFAREKGIPCYIIGNGSKLLVSDDGVRGMLVKISQNLSQVKVSNGFMVAEAGIQISELIEVATINNLSGIEFAAGIPGTLGGAVAMNAGVPPISMGDITEKVTSIDMTDGLQKVLSKNDCQFGYRHSVFSKGIFLILSVEMKFEHASRAEVIGKLANFIERRKKVQPSGKPSAGSVFKNPPNLFAGKLIEAAGLKGIKKGGAQISKIHANFIENAGDAKASDVFYLIELARKKVEELYGITLQPEIVFLGNFK